MPCHGSGAGVMPMLAFIALCVAYGTVWILANIAPLKMVKDFWSWDERGTAVWGAGLLVALNALAVVMACALADLRHN